MFFDQIVYKANDIVMVAEIAQKDGRFRITYVNEAFTRLFGYSAAEVLGRSPRILQGPDSDAATVEEISAAIHQGEPTRRRLLNYAKSGRQIWVEVNIVPLHCDGHVTHFASIERDVTADVQRESTLEDLALTDHLTKAGNRRHFDRILSREISRARRLGLPLSIAILDLDRFKSINDAWGHYAGDRVLVAFINTVQKAIGDFDYVARLGGEEFAVILPGAAGANAVKIIERLCAQVRSDAIAVTPDQSIHITCSAGVATLTTADEMPESFVTRADRALYMAKRAGRDRVFELAA